MTSSWARGGSRSCRRQPALRAFVARSACVGWDCMRRLRFPARRNTRPTVVLLAWDRPSLASQFLKVLPHKDQCIFTRALSVKHPTPLPHAPGYWAARQLRRVTNGPVRGRAEQTKANANEPARDTQPTVSWRSQHARLSRTDRYFTLGIDSTRILSGFSFLKSCDASSTSHLRFSTFR